MMRPEGPMENRVDGTFDSLGGIGAADLRDHQP